MNSELDNQCFAVNYKELNDWSMNKTVFKRSNSIKHYTEIGRQNGSLNTNQLRHHLRDSDFWKHFDHRDVSDGGLKELTRSHPQLRTYIYTYLLN